MFVGLRSLRQRSLSSLSLCALTKKCTKVQCLYYSSKFAGAVELSQHLSLTPALPYHREPAICTLAMTDMANDQTADLAKHALIVKR